MDDDIEDIFLDNDDMPSPHQHHDLHDAVETREEHKKFAYAVLGILIISSLLTTVRGWEIRRFIADFMAISFIAGAAYKFVNIEAFVTAYRRYDVIGSRIRPWAYIVPYVGAFLGFWYLLSSGPDRLNIVALLFTGIAAFGAHRAYKKPGKHPSLGGVFQLSLLKINLIESIALAVLAVVLLII